MSAPAPADTVGEPGPAPADTDTTGTQPDDQAASAQTGEPGTAEAPAAVESPAGQPEADESGAAEPGPTAAAGELRAAEPEADSTEPQTAHAAADSADTADSAAAEAAADGSDHQQAPQLPDHPCPRPARPGSGEMSPEPVTDAPAPDSSSPAEPGPDPEVEAERAGAEAVGSDPEVEAERAGAEAVGSDPEVEAEAVEPEPAPASEAVAVAEFVGAEGREPELQRPGPEPAEAGPDRSPPTAAQPPDGSTAPDPEEASGALASGERPWDPLDPSSPIEIDGDDRWFEDLREHGPTTWWHDRPCESPDRLPFDRAPQPGACDTTWAADQPRDGEDDDPTAPAAEPVVSDRLREDYAPSVAAPARGPDGQPGETAEAAGVPATTTALDVSPRMRLLRAMRPRATRAQGLAMLLCFVLGLAGFLAVRQNQNLGLASMRQSDLVSLLDNLTEKSTRLEEETRRLQGTADKLRSGTDRSAAALDAAKQRLDLLGILAGTSPAVGPGIELSITDPRNQVNSRILLDALQELRDAGAEAMQIGGVRVVASTSLVDANGGVRVDGTLLKAPYTLLAIGDPQTLSSAMSIPGGVLETLRQQGATGRVTLQTTLAVSALRVVSAPQYARPAASAGP